MPTAELATCDDVGHMAYRRPASRAAARGPYCTGAVTPSGASALVRSAQHVHLNGVGGPGHQDHWATVDSPWVHTVDPARYLDTLGELRDLDPALILSTHLPPAQRRTPEFLQTLTAAPTADAFIGPDQAAIEQMLAGFEPSPAAG